MSFIDPEIHEDLSITVLDCQTNTRRQATDEEMVSAVVQMIRTLRREVGNAARITDDH